MNRILKWVYIVTVAFIGVLFIHSIMTNPLEFGLSFTSSPDIVSTIIMIATSGVCVLMVARLLPVYWKKKKEPLLVAILISIFLFLGLTILVQGLFSLIDLKPHQLELVCTQSAFFYLAAAGFLLAQFQIEVFGGGLHEGRNRTWLIVIACIALVLDVGIVIDTIFGSEPWQLGLIGAPAVVVLYYLFAKLAYSALHTVNKIEDPVVKRSYHLMGLGWAMLFFGFIFLIVGGYFDFEDFIGSTAFVILSIVTFGIVFTGTSFLYVGFTLPMKAKASS